MNPQKPPGNLICASAILLSFKLRSNPVRKRYCCPHCADEETEAQRGEVTSFWSHSQMGVGAEI